MASILHSYIATQLRTCNKIFPIALYIANPYYTSIALRYLLHNIIYKAEKPSVCQYLSSQNGLKWDLLEKIAELFGNTK